VASQKEQNTKIDEVRHIVSLGAGTMGQQIALQCAMHGYDVTVCDLSSDVLRDATAKVRAYAEFLVEKKRLAPSASTEALSRITFTSKPEDAANADLVTESIPEDPDLKTKVFAQFNKICQPRAIFTTNTSTLLPSMYAEATGRPAQFAALHFYQFVWEANLVDITPHAATGAETVELLRAFARRIGQVPLVLKKEHARYVMNDLLEAINSTAGRLFDFGSGIASVEDIDRAFMIVLGVPRGPFAMLDFVGLDTAWHIMESNARLAHSRRRWPRLTNSRSSISTRVCSPSKPERASTPIQIQPTSGQAFSREKPEAGKSD
jgi:3-hydroxybutyryl-CoA dehydrogenase